MAPQQMWLQRREPVLRWAWALMDSLTFGIAIVLACWLRYELDAGLALTGGTLLVALSAGAGQLIVGGVLGPYGIGHERGSYEETVEVARTVGFVTLPVFAWSLAADPIIVPRSVPVTGAALAVVAMLTLRFLVRSSAIRRRTARPSNRRVVLFGAGDAGRRLCRTMLRETDSPFAPVAFLDDDRSKARLTLEGIPVRGNRADLAEVARATGATDLVIALPGADSTLIREVATRATQLGLRVLVLPPLSEILDGSPGTHDLRDVSLEDLLGRQPVQLDTSAIGAEVAGRRVLVTGAGGSIGSELCRQIARFEPAALLLLDRDESALQATQLSLAGHGLLDNDDVLLVDIRDPEAVRPVFEAHRPEVVFHAAALKHLPLLERYPLEAWKTNVVGTLNVLRAAEAVGVQTFVNISTDKAAHPSCVLGDSKRVAERLTADFAGHGVGRYVSVRFGNVLGSRGSVVPAFSAQIRAGGPVTVTHPDVKRYFMLIPEACQLVLQAAAVGHDGEVLVLDMGEQVPIVDVARALIRLSGRSGIDVVFTGLRPGEKLEEELVHPLEQRLGTSHPSVSRVAVPPLPPLRVETARHNGHEAAATWMHATAASEPAVQLQPKEVAS